LFKLYWVRDDGEGELFDLGEVLERYGSVFIGRFSGEDAREARRFGVVEKSYYSLYIFKPHEYYYSMNMEDSLVSRRHALLEFRGDSLFIVDHGPEGKGSKNGTFVNGKRIAPGKPHQLKHGDEISLGSLTKLIVIYKDAPLSIDTPTVLGKSEVEALRRAGVDMAIALVEEKSKYVVHIQQKVSTPITTPSGVSIIANPNLINTLTNLENYAREALNKVRSRESDAKCSVDYLVAHLSSSFPFIAKAIEDIMNSIKTKEKLLEEEKRKMLEEMLKEFMTAVVVLKDYAKGYGEEKTVVDSLNIVINRLRAIKETLSNIYIYQSCYNLYT